MLFCCFCPPRLPPSLPAQPKTDTNNTARAHHPTATTHRHTDTPPNNNANNSNRKAGFPCPRGHGKASKSTAPCPGKVDKSHPIVPRSEKRAKRAANPALLAAQQAASRQELARQRQLQQQAAAAKKKAQLAGGVPPRKAPPASRLQPRVV